MHSGLLLLSLASVAFCADILAVLPLTSYSHQIVYRRLMLELNRRGHNLTVLTPNPVNDPALRNYTEIDVSFFYKTWNTKMVANPKDLRLSLSFPELFFLPFTLIAEEMCHAYLSHPPVRDLIRKNPTYDLLITEFGVIPCFYGFAKFSGYKHVGIFSLQAFSVVQSNIGNPIDASYLPEVFLPYFGRMSFFQKLRILLFHAFMWAHYGYVMTAHDAIARKYFGDDLASLFDIERNLSALMVNAHFTLSSPRPNVPNMIEIGGPAFHLHGVKPKPLDKIGISALSAVNSRSRNSRSRRVKMHSGLLLLSLASVAFCADILAVLPLTSYSHQIVYRRLMLELNRRGHNLTVLTPNPVNDPALRNYTEIDVSFFYKTWNTKMVANPKDLRLGSAFPELLFLPFTLIAEEMCHTYLSHPPVRDLIRKNPTYDLLITEFGVIPCFYGFVKFSGYKHIGIFSFQAMPVVQSNIGNPIDASYLPEVYLPYFGRMSFFQKLRILLFQAFTWAHYGYVMTSHDAIARKYFGDDLASLFDIERNLSALMVNTHFTLSSPRPNVPNMIEIGGPAFHLHGVKPKPLDKDLKKFMDDAPHGVIYFSLGTNVKTNNMPSREEDMLLESFRRIKQKVVWKWENENLKVNLDNVYKSKWFPQIDVLAHPNVKAFVTQGGLQSIGEAIHFQVPLVVFPFFADQGHNARKMELEGAAIVLEIDELHPDTFTEALNQVVYNRTYKENIKRLSELVKDQPMPPLEKAVWWTEYVIRHNGAPHLRSAAATMPWYQYFLLDVLAFIFAVLFIFLYVLYRVCKFLKSLAFSSKSKKD